jgi:hypothetical protein
MKFSRLFVGSALVLTTAVAAVPQDQAPTGPPRILVIQREFLKPGKSGAAHEKTESAFIQAESRAKWPTHYLALQSLSGKPRSLFFTNYDSFDAWEKDNQSVQKNAVLSAALDHANEVDGTLLDSSDQGVFTYNAEISFHPKSDISQMRYLEIWIVNIKPGHYREWMELNKIYRAAYEKAVPTGHWATYEAQYGAPNGTFLYLTARKTAAELDKGPMEDKAVREAIGDEGMKKLDEMFASAVAMSESQFFSFSPAMSYPPDEWIKADPGYWKPKATTVTEAKTTKKPAGQP